MERDATRLLESTVRISELEAVTSIRMSCNGLFIISSIDHYVTKDPRWEEAVMHTNRLDLKVSYDSKYELFELAEALGGFMSKARELEVLNLQWTDSTNQDRYEEHHREHHLQFISRSAFPNLREICLTNTTIAGYRLLDFFGGHAKSLRSVSMIDVSIGPCTGH